MVDLIIIDRTIKVYKNIYSFSNISGYICLSYFDNITKKINYIAIHTYSLRHHTKKEILDNLDYYFDLIYKGYPIYASSHFPCIILTLMNLFR